MAVQHKPWYIVLFCIISMHQIAFTTAWKPSFMQRISVNVKSVQKAVGAGLLSTVLLFPGVVLNANAIEQQYKLPPIDFSDKTRCTLTSSAMGQANAARDKLYDLRMCDLTKQSAANKDLSGMIAAEADFSGVNFKEAQLSK